MLLSALGSGFLDLSSSGSELPAVPPSFELSDHLSPYLQLTSPVETSHQEMSHSRLSTAPPSFELSGQALLQVRYQNAPASSELLGRTLSRSGLSVTPTSRESPDINNLSMSCTPGLIELGTEHPLQSSRRAWEFDWSAFQSPSQEAVTPSPSLVFNPLGLNNAVPYITETIELGTGTGTGTGIAEQPVQAPCRPTELNESDFQLPSQEADVRDPSLIFTQPGYDKAVLPHFNVYGLASASSVQHRQSSVITFHCDRLMVHERDCSCACHSNRSFKSSGILDKFMGRLFIGYSSLPTITSSCNLEACRNRGSHGIRIQLSYTFPTWFVWKKLEIFAKSGISGPCLGLSLRNRINVINAMNILSAARYGDISMIIKLLEKREASLRDITLFAGESPFVVRILIFKSKYYCSCLSSSLHWRVINFTCVISCWMSDIVLTSKMMMGRKQSTAPPLTIRADFLPQHECTCTLPEDTEFLRWGRP